METSFPQFALLPLELRRAIWESAALSWTQDIHFLLPTPKAASEEPFYLRKHLFASEICTPPLLYTCHDSRVAALKRYKLGLNIKANAATSGALDRGAGRLQDCAYEGQIEELGKRTYWIPENDVVVLEHGIPPYVCETDSVCNLRGLRRHTYQFDSRMRYLAVTMDVWNCGSGNIVLDIPGLEVLFVLVDPKPCFAFSSTGIPFKIIGSGAEDYLDEREENVRESCRIVETQMTKTLRFNQVLFRLKHRLGVQLKAEVILVGNIEELIDVVAQRRNERIRAVSNPSAT